MTRKTLSCVLCSPDDTWQWVDSADALKVYGIFFALLLVGELPLLRVSTDPPKSPQDALNRKSKLMHAPCRLYNMRTCPTSLF